MRSEESQREESNLRPADYESAALPSELRWPGHYLTLGLDYIIRPGQPTIKGLPPVVASALF